MIERCPAFMDSGRNEATPGSYSCEYEIPVASQPTADTLRRVIDNLVERACLVSADWARPVGESSTRNVVSDGLALLPDETGALGRSLADINDPAKLGNARYPQSLGLPHPTTNHEGEQ